MPLVSRWWVFVLRGLAAILFGLLTFFRPGISLAVLIALFGAYAIVDGIVNLALAIQGARFREPRWGWLILEGVLSIAAGFLTFAIPGLTALVLLYFIAFWALATGVAEIAAAIRLRRVIHGEWLLGLAGVLSILLGIILLRNPAAGAVAVVLWIGAYALVFGVLLVALGIRLYLRGREVRRHIPTGGIPAGA